MNSYILLIACGLLPVIASVVLHFIFKINKLKDMNYVQKQIIIGIIFGGIAIFGTEKGIPINGAAMNARDAAPLCAALIFGAPAGIIAGFIGGIERWFSVYWGVGAYTRVACSVSTFLVGVIGAILKKYMFEDKLPNAWHSFAVGLICETLHMMMVFITNMSDVRKAFEVVKACAIPMISVNALAVFIAVLVISLIDKKNRFKQKGIKTLSSQFQQGLWTLIFVAFVLTSTFNFVLQSRKSISETEEILKLNIEDIVNDVNSKTNQSMLRLIEDIEERIGEQEITNDLLKEIADEFEVAEISFIDKNNYIVNSNVDEYIGFDMSSGEQANEFSCLLKGEQTYIQAYMPTTSGNGSVYRKYAGKANADGYIQVGYDAVQFQNDIAQEVDGVATYRHIGETGGLIVIDSYNLIVSDSFGLGYVNASNVGINLDRTLPEMNLNTINVYGEDYYYMYTKSEGYTIIAVRPVIEADYGKSVSIYLNTFMETITFGGLFILVFFMIRSLVVNHVKEIDDSLQSITDGNLDTVVNVNTNEEFISLSKGINTTVNSMKHLIDEANKRIDDELQYAKDIQFSSLPSIFPPFPERNEFDIYASMDPAKEVGGDFYDFYMIGKHTLAFLIADVAGKGIPAALFMMRAKSILKTYAEAGIEVADIFTNANYNLCEGNDAGMFVTAWMGFLNLETGEIKFANAGHNPPMIRRKGGEYEYLKTPAGFVLAGMEGIVYKEQTITLEPGDEIFLYTDGVPEATNSQKELFNENRLKECINKYKDFDSENMCTLVKKEVDEFYEGAPQFDDITMLSVKLLSLVGKDED